MGIEWILIINIFWSNSNAAVKVEGFKSEHECLAKGSEISRQQANIDSYSKGKINTFCISRTK